MTQKNEPSDLDTTNSTPQSNAEQPDDDNWPGDDEYAKQIRRIEEVCPDLPQLPQYYLDD